MIRGDWGNAPVMSAGGLSLFLEYLLVRTPVRWGPRTSFPALCCCPSAPALPSCVLSTTLDTIKQSLFT